MKTKNKNQINE